MEERSEIPAPPLLPATTKPTRWTTQRIIVAASAILGGIIVLIFLIGVIFALFSDFSATAPRIQIVRDTLVILISLEFMLIIAAATIVAIQIARFVLLLQVEVKPLLDNTNEAVTSAKGTVDFVGQNVAEPVVRAGAFLAGAGVFMREMGGIRRAIRRNGKGKEIEPTK